MSGNPSLKDMYEQTNQRTESMTKIIVFGMIHASYPTFMIFTLIVNFYMYFAMDLGADAFRLPFPFWYVCKCVN